MTCWVLHFCFTTKPQWNYQQITFYFSPSLALFSHRCSLSLSCSLSSSLDHHCSFPLVHPCCQLVCTPSISLALHNYILLNVNKHSEISVLISILTSLFCEWSGTQVVVAAVSVLDQSATVSHAKLKFLNLWKVLLPCSRNIFTTWSYRTGAHFSPWFLRSKMQVKFLSSSKLSYSFGTLGSSCLPCYSDKKNEGERKWGIFTWPELSPGVV